VNESQETDFKVGDWWVRPRRNELERGEEAVCVEGRSMGVLVCLARHAPKVVSRERLLEEVWADSPFISEEVINHSIYDLRKAFGDPAKQPAYIRTIPRKGYQLLKEVLRPQGAPLPIEGVRIDHYDIQEELGAGSMGVVYKAVDRRLGRTVAIKFLAPELTRDLKARKRFQREASLAASLDHPNLATVHEIGETTDGHQYMVTAYYPGGSLQDKLACGAFTLEESLSLARQIAAGLGAAHQREIIHRDIKPANLLLDDHGTLKIADFGIAKLQNATQLTRTGASLGTPAYKSPEQAEGLEVDHRTDIWSLGVVLFELLTGRRPFAGDFEQAIVHSILSKEPEPLKDRDSNPLPAAVSRIVTKAMAKDRDQRYQSGAEVIRDLDGVGVGSRSASKPAKRKSFRILITALALAILAAFGATLLPQWLSPSDSSMVTEASDVREEATDWRLKLGRDIWLRGRDLSNLREAEEHFEAAFRQSPNRPDIVGHLAMLRTEIYNAHRILENREAAQAMIDRAFQLTSIPALAWAATARLLVIDEKPDEARDAAQKAVDIDGSCDRGDSCDFGYLLLGEALWLLGRTIEAEQVFSQCNRYGGGPVRCNLKLAQLKELAGDRVAAAAAFKRVLEFDPDQTTALNDLGALYLVTNQYSEAAGYFRRAFSLAGNPITKHNLGNALAGNRLWPDAIAAFMEAHRLFEEAGILEPTPLVSVGDVYLEQGDRERAAEPYLKAILVFDAMEQTSLLRTDQQGQRAVCLAKLGRFDEAEKEIERLEQKSDPPRDLFVYAARVQALKGDRGRLFFYAEKAIAQKIEPHRLVDDAAFIEFRDDQEYRRLLEPPV